VVLYLFKLASSTLILLLIFLIPAYGFYKKLDIYSIFIEGAKEGLLVVVRIFPYVLGMFIAINMFRESGAMDFFVKVLTPVTGIFNFPTELLPLAIIRPLSGGASLGLVADYIKNYGVDSLLSRMASAMYGSTETTFYVLTVYFGAVGIKKIRHSLLAGLFADLIGIISSVIFCRIFFG